MSPRRLGAGQLGRVTDLAAAPAGTTVAVAARNGRLLVVDVASGQVTELAASDRRAGDRAGLVAGLGLARLGPAGAAAAVADPAGPARRRRHRRRHRRPVQPTPTPSSAPTGAISPSCPGAASTRCTTRTPSTCRSRSAARPYLVPLAAGTPSPFGPLPDGRPVGHGAQRGGRRRRRAGAAGRHRGHRGAGPSGRAGARARVAVLLAAGGQGRPGLAPRTAVRRARRGLGRAGQPSAASLARAVRPRPAAVRRGGRGSSTGSRSAATGPSWW